MLDIAGGFLYLLSDCLKCTLKLCISVKILFRVFKGRKRWIQRNNNILAAVIICRLEFVGAFLKPVAIGVYQFAVYSVFISFFGILKLLLLKLELFYISLENSGNYLPQISRFLPYAGHSLFLGVIRKKKIEYAVEILLVEVFVQLRFKYGKFRRSAVLKINRGGICSAFYIRNKELECMKNMGSFAGRDIRRESVGIYGCSCGNLLGSHWRKSRERCINRL